MIDISVIVALKDDPITPLLYDMQSQTIANNIEIIVVDGSDKDSVKEEINGHPITVPVQYLHRPGSNVYDAWNIAIEHSNGNYVTNANADDLHFPISLEVMRYELANRNVGIVYADCLLEARGRFLGIWRQPDWDEYQALTTCPFGPQPMWKRYLNERFDAGHTQCADYESFLKVAMRNGAYHIPRILGIYSEARKGFSRKDPGETETQEMLAPYRQKLGGPAEFKEWVQWCSDNNHRIRCATRNQINFANLYKI